MKKAFITGITGFAGSFLAENLVQKGYETSGTYLTEESLINVKDIRPKIKLRKVDLQKEAEVKTTIEQEKPDLIFHLAALTAPGESFKNPAEFINNNIAAQLNVFEAARSIGINPAILIISSAEVYGNVKASDLPIDENTELRPVNPYAVSKVAQDFLGLQYFLSYKLPIVRVRPFNHIGPRQSPSFVVSSFAKKIAEIEKGSEPVLKVGNLNAKRDFTAVEDMVEAYAGVIEKGEPGEVYNIGSGKSVEIKYILDTLLSFSNKKITVEEDPSLMRPLDIPEFVCDFSKIKEKIAWTPQILIEDSLRRTLDYWRGIV